MSDDQREAAASRVKIAEAALAQADADLAFNEALLQNTVIRAPFGGVVVKKMAEVGESVAPIPPGVNISTASGAIVALADLETLEVEVDVAEANVARLAGGQPAEVTVEAFPDRRYKAVLRQVIPTADRTKATVHGQGHDPRQGQGPEARDERQGHVPRAGQTGRSGPRRRRSRWCSCRGGASSPATASRRVFAVREGKVAGAPGRASGPQRQGQVIVQEGLAGGETIVAKPRDELKDGDVGQGRSG